MSTNENKVGEKRQREEDEITSYKETIVKLQERLEQQEALTRRMERFMEEKNQAGEQPIPPDLTPSEEVTMIQAETPPITIEIPPYHTEAIPPERECSDKRESVAQARERSVSHSSVPSITSAREEWDKEMLSKMFQQNERLMKLLEEKEVGRPNQMDETTSRYLRQDKASMESSKGDLKSGLLNGYDFPDEWPVYQWPKAWEGRKTMVRALLAMKGLQKKYTLQEAVVHLGTQCEKLGRSLFPSDWRILKPIKEGDSSPSEQDAWELCLIGVADLEPSISIWMQVAREVNPSLVENVASWQKLISGGEWPKVSTDGHIVGKNKNGFFQQNKKGFAKQQQQQGRPGKTVFPTKAGGGKESN